MTSLPIDALSLLDLVLICALVATAGYAIVLRREFKRFRTYNADYAAILAQTGVAVAGVERAVDSVQTEGASVLLALGERIEEARTLASRLEAAKREAPREATRGAPTEPSTERRSEPRPEPRSEPRERPLPETPAPFRPRPDQTPKAYAWPTVVVKRLPDGV